MFPGGIVIYPLSCNLSIIRRNLSFIPLPRPIKPSGAVSAAQKCPERNKKNIVYDNISSGKIAQKLPIDENFPKCA